MPGRWRTSRIEAARGPMMAVTDPTVKKITVMGPTQLLKTELINNIVGYFIHQDPSPMIVMQPTGSMAETWSKDRLDKMIRDTPVLSELVKSKKSRDSDNTILHKSFPGGHITIVGSNSPTELASRPVRITLRDEVDKYPSSAGDEGDPSSLIIERSATFWNSLDVGVCSPTIKGRSKIEQEYLASDQRKFHVDCPHCGHNHFMIWGNVYFENKDPETAAYVCPECKTMWSEQDRLKAISNGAYVAHAPFKGHAGFHVNKLASPWEPLSTLVRKWLEAQGDVEKLKTFINTQLAETWEQKGESPEHMRLYERREFYPINANPLPEGVVFLTAGVDVQKDRIECEIVGWGRGKQSWSIDYRVYMGDTSNIDSSCWKELDKVLNETWSRANGTEVPILVLGIDSGYNTQTVYTWARKYPSNRVMVTKGQDNLQNILGIPSAADVTHAGTKVKRSVRVWPIGVSTAKSELYGWLNLDGAKDDGIYPPGFCHFPQYDENYFKGLTAEQLVKTKNKKGHTVYAWVKSFERNEPLDCRVIARAAAAMAGMDRFKDHDWLNLEGVSTAPIRKPTTPTSAPVTTPAADKSNPNPFWKNSGRKNYW